MPSPASLSSNLNVHSITKLSIRDGKQTILDRLPSISAANCSPPTPAAELHANYEMVKAYIKPVEAIVHSLTVYNLDMAPFASAVNAYLAYINSITRTMCLNANNRAAYDGLNSLITQSNTLVTRGIATFENNLNMYASGALPLLQNILNACQGINVTSRDFTTVADGTQRYNSFNTAYAVDIYQLSQGIAITANRLNTTSAQADQAVGAAMAQLEINVAREVEVVVQKAAVAAGLIQYWENVDGEAAYKSYKELVTYTAEVLVPQLGIFLERIPSTYRVQESIRKAEQAVKYIEYNFNAFPVFTRLPPSSNAFPYLTYNTDQRKFGEAKIIAVLQAACLAYFNETGYRLHIGDMQLEHGGRIIGSKHQSHKVGRDADVDAVEVGNVGYPNYNSSLALLAAQCFLQAGASLVFYAEPSVIALANQWAVGQGLQGRLQFQGDHTHHFHLRTAL